MKYKEPQNACPHFALCTCLPRGKCFRAWETFIDQIQFDAWVKSHAAPTGHKKYKIRRREIIPA